MEVEPMSCGTVCCESSYTTRNFLTSEEKVERLNEYKEWLVSETKGVEEAIKKL